MIQRFRLKSVYIIIGLIFGMLAPFIPIQTVRGQNLPEGFSFQYGIVRWDPDFYIPFPEDPVAYSYSGQSKDNYTFTWENVSWSEARGKYVRYVESGWMAFECNYSSEMSQTLEGYMHYEPEFDMYNVNVSYGNELDLIWMAVKNGTYKVTVNYTEDATGSYSYKANYTIDRETLVQEYDIETGTLLFEDTYTYSDYQQYEETWPARTKQEFVIMNNLTSPMIMTTQNYKTPDGKTVAWTDVMTYNMVYNDTDENDVLTMMDMNMNQLMAGECEGTYLPLAGEWDMNDDGVIDSVFPNDKHFLEYADDIIFTTPTYDSGTGAISWDITYPDYPLLTYTGIGAWNPNADPGSKTHAWMSPGTYKYGYDYTVDPTQGSAKLASTVDLPKITNDTLLAEVANMSLSLPHYTFFMVPEGETTDQTTNTSVSKPADIFGYLLGTQKFAEFDYSLEPSKTNYTLFDYPTVGTNLERKAIGSSACQAAAENIAVDYMELVQQGAGLVYSLYDFVAYKTGTTAYDSFFSVQAVNYPVWSGQRVLHDPVFSCFFPADEEETPPDDTTPTDNNPQSQDPGTTDGDENPTDDGSKGSDVPGYALLSLLGVVLVTTVILLRKHRFDKR